MKISRNWLNHFIDTEAEVEEIGKILTEIGLEVEGIESYETVKGGLKGVVVGEVIACEKHPNADKLKITKVNIGESEPLSIVCGAPNVAVGQKVPVATIGTVLYPNGEELKIKKGKIRGEYSFGMICAEDELGIGTNHDGIMVLDNAVATGTPMIDLLNIKEDRIYEIGLTPNRADAMSHYGVARDLYVASKQRGVDMVWKPLEAIELLENPEGMPISLKVLDADKCPRYTGVNIQGVTVKDSPDWLATALKSIGLKPINNIVDITNYVMHHLGQPLHAFDYDKIEGHEVIIAPAKEGEKFTTLDGVERTLTADDLMIRDSKKSMCIAGVFGGLDSGVTNDTETVFLESAYFDPVTIRKSSKRHAINTDSSFRFERGVDPNITKKALEFATRLILEIAGGSVSSAFMDTHPEHFEHFPVELRFLNMDNLIGESIHRHKIKDILADLEIEITEDNDEKLHLLVPPYRVDVQREVDVIEEILRIYGFNKIGTPEKLHTSLSYQDDLSEKDRWSKAVKSNLVGNGFMEIMNNSLTKKAYFEKYDGDSTTQLVELLNPLSSDLNVLRATPIFGFLESIRHNQNRKNSNLRFFEFGYTYHKYSEYEETSFLCLAITGNWLEQSWEVEKLESDYFILKGYVEQLIHSLNPEIKIQFKPAKKSNILSSAMEILVGKTRVGKIGMVNPQIAGDFEIKVPVYLADLEAETLRQATERKIVFQELPKFNAIQKDMAFIIDKGTSFQEMVNTIQKTSIPELQDIELFDVYEGDKLPEDKKSYALRFTLLDYSKTLNDKQIDAIMGKIDKALSSQLDAKLRNQ